MTQGLLVGGFPVSTTVCFRVIQILCKVAPLITVIIWDLYDGALVASYTPSTVAVWIIPAPPILFTSVILILCLPHMAPISLCCK